MPFFLKILDLENLLCRKKLQNIILMWGSLLVTEQRLKHFNWPLIHFSITDSARSLFFGSPGMMSLRGESPNGLYSLRQVTEVKLGRVRSDSGWVNLEA